MQFQSTYLIVRGILLLVAGTVTGRDVDFRQAGRTDQLQVWHRAKVASLAGGRGGLLQVQRLPPVHQLREIALVLEAEIVP